MTDPTLKERIHQKISELAALGGNDGHLGDDELIIAAGVIDSGALMELISWYEIEIDVSLDIEEITIDNLGTVNQMVEFAAVKTQSKTAG